MILRKTGNKFTESKNSKEGILTLIVVRASQFARAVTKRAGCIA